MVASLRALFSVPAHISWALVIGVNIACNKYLHKPERWYVFRRSLITH